MYSKILVAIDNSAHSMKAAKAGFALAHELKATIGILFVIDKSKELLNADLGITPQQSQTVLLAEAEKTIEQYIRWYDGISNVERFTPEGFPEKEIINVSEEWNADLIVMGTHVRSTLGRILTGSVAEYVIRHSKIPVLITPPRME